MDENKNNIPTENEGEELDNILTLNDEDGNEVEFEFLDLIEYEGEEYVILLPVEDEEEAEEPGEVVILKLEDTENEDEDILNAVFEKFKEKFKDDFNFVD